ncbi:MAG: signal peptide peptidase SppA [bacterium]
MNNKILASIIIALCLISIVIGISSTVISSKKVEQEQAKGSKKFKNIFNSGNKIALITLEGTIDSGATEGLIGSIDSAESALKALKRAFEDNTVKGVLFRINSPGGTVAISQEIYNTVLRLRKKKPVVISMSDVTASGGYYISCAADRIYADPGTLTGSIGVVMNIPNVQKLFNQKLGIDMNTIKSGKFKDIASPYRPLSIEERKMLQNMITTVYNQFVNAIIEGRVKRNDKYTIEKTNLTVKTLKQYADGRIFSGEQAQKLGFVDQLGGMYEAQKGVNKMAQTRFNLLSSDLPLVSYNRPSGLSEFIFGLSESIMPKKDPLSSVMPFNTKYFHQPLFLWE